MKTRLEDIAARAGVSVATVSRVVNGKAGVSEETRNAVLAVVELLGYDRPAPVHRTKTGLVGVIVPELENPIFPLFVQHVEYALAAHDYTPMLCTASPVIQEDEYVDMLLAHEVAGIVFVAGRHANTQVDYSRYSKLLDDGLPMVFINGHIDGLDACFVSTDDRGAMASAVNYLRSQGHCRIGCAMGPSRYISSQRKVEGFVDAVVAPLSSGSDATDPRKLVSYAVYTISGGEAAAQQLLDDEVTAIVSGSDLMAVGAIRAARERGLRVPEDVSVIGFDGTPLLAMIDPPLTTLRQDVEAMSRHAVETLVNDIVGETQSCGEVLFSTELVVRGSTAPARPPDTGAPPPMPVAR